MDLDPRDTTTALVHLYRGELQRMVTYRVRLDTTTNWAIGTAAGLISFALGHDGAPHFVLVLGLLMGLVFVWIEARRFQVFEMIRLRVRLLERGQREIRRGRHHRAVAQERAPRRERRRLLEDEQPRRRVQSHAAAEHHSLPTADA